MSRSSFAICSDVSTLVASRRVSSELSSVVLDRQQFAVDADARRRADGDVKVRSTLAHHQRQEFFHRDHCGEPLAVRGRPCIDAAGSRTGGPNREKRSWRSTERLPRVGACAGCVRALT